nr:hypothetical protein [candidate division Zixibacteria bacterium]
MKKTLILSVTATLILCAAFAAGEQSKIYPFSLDYAPERSVLRVFPTPPGYERFPSTKMNTFMAWITNLPLENQYHPLIYWNQNIITRADSIAAVVDLAVGSVNQKDPDVAMQIVIEFLHAVGQLDNFPIILSPRDTITYDHWLGGSYKRDAHGSLVYKSGEKRPSNEKEYYRFLEFIFGRLENKNLLLNLSGPIEMKNIQPGDLYIQFDPKDPDSSGHTAMIFDICSNKDGAMMFLFGMGGDPARSLYLPRPWPVDNRNWFTPDEFKKSLAEFGPGNFYRLKYLK